MDDAELLADIVEILVKIGDIAKEGGGDERLFAGIEITGKDVAVGCFEPV